MAVGFLSVLFLALPTAAAPPNGAAVRTQKDLTYFAGPAEEAESHRLDLYLPAGKRDFPFLLFIHGGGWSKGRRQDFAFVGERFARQGVGVAIADYRLTPAVRHPEHVRDVARAFGWLVAHAKEFGGDPKRLYLAGHSAGAHMVSLLAADPKYLEAEGLTAESVRAVIGISGPYWLPNGLYDEVFGRNGAQRADAFPVNHVGRHPGQRLPPFLLLHADRDLPGLELAAKLMQSALGLANTEVKLRQVKDRDHDSILNRLSDPGDRAAALIMEFIAGH
jgi:acetyl esterase/lipase